MNPQDAIDLSREAIKTCMMVGGPILIVSLLIGLLVGVFQAMTQVQDQTVSFVPKILLLTIAIGACLPWLTEQMLDFARYSLERPFPQSSLASSSPGFDAPADVGRSVFSTSIADTISFVAPQRPSDSAIEPANVATPTGDRGATMPSVRPASPPDETELESPFMLPHYRFSRVPKNDTDG